jgi:hypothetical protein
MFEHKHPSSLIEQVLRSSEIAGQSLSGNDPSDS